jgi:hypothetical protein
MAMGKSAGRSARNRTGEGAQRRNTPREREFIDPPFPDGPPAVRFAEPEAVWVDRLFSAVAWVSVIAFGVLGGVILAAWFGVI